MKKLVVFMRFEHPEHGKYSGKFSYCCRTTEECNWCCQQEVKEFKAAGWDLTDFQIIEYIYVGRGL